MLCIVSTFSVLTVSWKIVVGQKIGNEQRMHKHCFIFYEFWFELSQEKVIERLTSSLGKEADG